MIVTLLDALAHGPRLCVGIDPTPEVLRAWGFPDSVDGLRGFVDRVLEICPPETSVVKPQIAYFERFGSRGLNALEHLCGELRRRGLAVILDAKRGDIPSTNEGYVSAYLVNDAPCVVDAMTVSPYLGVGSLEPFFAAARAHDRVIFVLAKTSNPEARAFQDTPAERPMWLRVAQELADSDSHVGFVVGASDTELADFAAGRFGPSRPLLVPGTGTQGGKLAEVREALGRAPAAVTISRQLFVGGPHDMPYRYRAARDELAARPGSC
jgi:orotidine-5'-phosphate decarboxylase